MSIALGDRIAFAIEDGTVTVEPKDDWVKRTAGIVKGRGPENLSAEELDDLIDQAWADAAIERDERSKQS